MTCSCEYTKIYVQDCCIDAYIRLAVDALNANRMMWPARPKFHETWTDIDCRRNQFGDFCTSHEMVRPKKNWGVARNGEEAIFGQPLQLRFHFFSTKDFFPRDTKQIFNPKIPKEVIAINQPSPSQESTVESSIRSTQKILLEGSSNAVQLRKCRVWNIWPLFGGIRGH